MGLKIRTGILLSIALYFSIVGIALHQIHSAHGPHQPSMHIEHGAPNEIGVSCANGHDPQVLGMEEQTLIVVCK